MKKLHGGKFTHLDVINVRPGDYILDSFLSQCYPLLCIGSKKGVDIAGEHWELKFLSPLTSLRIWKYSLEEQVPTIKHPMHGGVI